MVLTMTIAIIGITALLRLQWLRAADMRHARRQATEARRQIEWSPYMIRQITADRRRDTIRPGFTQFQ